MIQETHIDSALKELFGNLTFTQKPEGLYDPLRYMINIGGKRIRPRLCLTAYALFKDGLCEEVLAPAAALEVFHSFTLIHDDIMDKADVRRGVPTVYRKWDENTAILSGDVMSIESYKLVAKAPAEVLPEVLGLFSKTAAEVCEGQQYDMDFEDLECVPMSDYLKMIGLKTAVLIACSAKMGAIIAGASEKECSLLYDFGYDLGLAFQIADDWLDTYGDPKVFGKNIGGDILCNKKTYLYINALRLADKEQRAILDHWAAASDYNPEEKVAAVTDVYNKVGLPAMSRAIEERYYRKALASLEALSVSEEKKSVLREFMANLMERDV